MIDADGLHLNCHDICPQYGVPEPGWGVYQECPSIIPYFAPFTIHDLAYYPETSIKIYGLQVMGIKWPLSLFLIMFYTYLNASRYDNTFSFTSFSCLK